MDLGEHGEVGGLALHNPALLSKENVIEVGLVIILLHGCTEKYVLDLKLKWRAV